ncbi:MAG: Trk system potassium transporter TrkA [Thermoleophilia bacterium]|nr:Trk system potassium transporter TrkA [Thermoleophilia bacterium]
MRVLVVGAGQVGSTIVEALHADHSVTVIDTDQARLRDLAYRFDRVRTVQGNGASREVLVKAGLAEATLVIACTSRDEVNLVACAFTRLENRSATVVIRTTNIEYVEMWRAGQLDVDFAVSSELETARAVMRLIGLPTARQTDVFADGQVQIVEFDVTETASHALVGRPLREATIPDDSRIAAIIRPGALVLPRGDDAIAPGDRIVVIGSPAAARAWSGLLHPGATAVENVVVWGGGQVGTAIAREALREGIAVRLIEPHAERARAIAEELPACRVFETSGIDPDFLARERIGGTKAGIFAMREDARNLFAATLARLHGLEFSIAIVHDPLAVEVYEAGGIDVSVNPRQVTAQEIVRFAHDPRTRQVAMLEGDRFEVLDLTTSATSEYVGLTFREMPIRGALIGAIVRNGKAVFPRSDDTLLAGDRVIVFTETSGVAAVEKVL